MEERMNKARLAGLGFGIALIIVAFGLVWWQSANVPVTNVAFAQGTTATATPTAAAPTVPSTAPSTAPQQQQTQPAQAIGDTFWGILAGKLNISADTLKAQAVEARKQMIDQAVTDGRITQEQGEALKARLTSDNLIAPIQLPRTGQGFPQNGPQNNNQNGGRRPFPGFGNGGNGSNPFLPFLGGMMGGRGMGFGLENLDAIASALKLDSKALVEQLSQGKTLADIAKAQGVDEATVKQAIITAQTAQVDKLLSLGLISEAQATQMKSQLTPDSIDLSRPLFRFRMMQGGQQSSDMVPDDFMGLLFGQGGGDMNQLFGQDGNGFFQFFQNNQPAPSGGSLTIPGADIQTQ